MKGRITVSAVRVSTGVSLVCVAAMVGGCGREEARTAAVAPAGASVKGEPIRGEPIGKLAGPIAVITNAVPASNSPATATGVVAVASAVPVPAPVAASTSGGGANTAVSAVSGDTLVLGFDKLSSFQYTLPDGPVDTNTVATTQASAQIPDAIRALNNRLISLKGFMLPLKVEKGLVTELLIMRDQSMCCYGSVPRINEWVSVKMVGGGVKPIMDQPVTLFGKLKVGEMYENGYLVGIYALDGDRMAGPLDM